MRENCCTASTTLCVLSRMPSIADVALYPYLALAPEGGLALDHYPALNAWIARIRALPGYIPMPGL